MREPDKQAESFEALAMPLFDSLFNFACWLTHNRDQAEDLVQETYARALKGFGSFMAGTNFRAWMFRILRNTFLSSKAGRNTVMVAIEPENEESLLPPTTETPESLLLAAVDQRLLQEAIEQLALPFREIILLAEVEEMSYQEMADALGIPLGTVMSRLARARKALRSQLSAAVQRT